MADESSSPETRVYAQRSIESSLVSFRQLLAMPDLLDEIRDELITALNSFWDA
jgi:hypothetical protein